MMQEFLSDMLSKVDEHGHQSYADTAERCERANINMKDKAEIGMQKKSHHPNKSDNAQTPQKTAPGDLRHVIFPVALAASISGYAQNFDRWSNLVPAPHWHPELASRPPRGGIGVT